MLLVKLMRMNIFIRFNRTLAIFRVECERIIDLTMNINKKYYIGIDGGGTKRQV